MGDNYHGQLGVNMQVNYVSDFTKLEFDFGPIKHVACGYEHAVLVNSNDQIYIWGSNQFSCHVDVSLTKL